MLHVGYDSGKKTKDTTVTILIGIFVIIVKRKKVKDLFRGLGFISSRQVANNFVAFSRQLIYILAR